jgi:hypothetical protein
MIKLRIEIYVKPVFVVSLLSAFSLAFVCCLSLSLSLWPHGCGVSILKINNYYYYYYYYCHHHHHHHHRLMF